MFIGIYWKLLKISVKSGFKVQISLKATTKYSDHLYNNKQREQNSSKYNVYFKPKINSSGDAKCVCSAKYLYVCMSMAEQYSLPTDANCRTNEKLIEIFRAETKLSYICTYVCIYVNMYLTADAAAPTCQRDMYVKVYIFSVL